jgi:long-subunit acyl-CoA synthetase (AMP-forming)
VNPVRVSGDPDLGVSSVDSARTAADADTEQRPETMIEAFDRTVAQRGDQVAIHGPADDLTWNQLKVRAENLARGLVGLGVRKDVAVALMLGNRPEFHLVDIAAMQLGAVPFSVYPTLPVAQIRHLLDDSGAHVVITESRFADAVRDAAASLDSVAHIVMVDADTEEVVSLADLESSGADSAVDLDPFKRAVDSESLLTLIYTSGTTGPSKGVELLHRNALAAVDATTSRIPFPDDSKVISWLPAAHIAERIAHHYLPIAYGVQITTCDDMKQIGRYLREVEPTWFFAVPRIWEKLKAGLEASIAGLDPARADHVVSAIEAGLQRVRLEQAGQQTPPDLAQRLAALEDDVFAPLRTQLGFANLVTANVGSAPVPTEVIEFFHAIGVPLSELYGMSETFGVGCSNPRELIKIGTVGPAAPGVELALAPDGEIMLRSRAVMRGYRNLPDKTAEVLIDGWYYTGDIGRIDDDGYLSIVDRKKDMIINSAGKNMSPAHIESTIKAASPLIAQICVIGDARPYNTALVVLDPDAAAVWAPAHGLSDAGVASLAESPDLNAELTARIDEANNNLSRPEQIKKFLVLPVEWLPGGEELTPTAKVKRKAVYDKYASEIADLYT